MKEKKSLVIIVLMILLLSNIGYSPEMAPPPEKKLVIPEERSTEEIDYDSLTGAELEDQWDSIPPEEKTAELFALLPEPTKDKFDDLVQEEQSKYFNSPEGADRIASCMDCAHHYYQSNPDNVRTTNPEVNDIYFQTEGNLQQSTPAATIYLQDIYETQATFSIGDSWRSLDSGLCAGNPDDCLMGENVPDWTQEISYDEEQGKWIFKPNLKIISDEFNFGDDDDDDGVDIDVDEGDQVDTDYIHTVVLEDGVTVNVNEDGDMVIEGSAQGNWADVLGNINQYLNNQGTLEITEDYVLSEDALVELQSNLHSKYIEGSFTIITSNGKLSSVGVSGEGRISDNYGGVNIDDDGIALLTLNQDGTWNNLNGEGIETTYLADGRHLFSGDYEINFNNGYINNADLSSRGTVYMNLENDFIVKSNQDELTVDFTSQLPQDAQSSTISLTPEGNFVANGKLSISTPSLLYNGLQASSDIEFFVSGHDEYLTINGNGDGKVAELTKRVNIADLDDTYGEYDQVHIPMDVTSNNGVLTFDVDESIRNQLAEISGDDSKFLFMDRNFVLGLEGTQEQYTINGDMSRQYVSEDGKVVDIFSPEQVHFYMGSIDSPMLLAGNVAQKEPGKAANLLYDFEEENQGTIDGGMAKLTAFQIEHELVGEDLPELRDGQVFYEGQDGSGAGYRKVGELTKDGDEWKFRFIAGWNALDRLDVESGKLTGEITLTDEEVESLRQGRFPYKSYRPGPIGAYDEGYYSTGSMKVYPNTYLEGEELLGSTVAEISYSHETGGDYHLTYKLEDGSVVRESDLSDEGTSHFYDQFSQDYPELSQRAGITIAEMYMRDGDLDKTSQYYQSVYDSDSESEHGQLAKGNLDTMTTYQFIQSAKVNAMKEYWQEMARTDRARSVISGLEFYDQLTEAGVWSRAMAGLSSLSPWNMMRDLSRDDFVDNIESSKSTALESVAAMETMFNNLRAQGESVSLTDLQNVMQAAAAGESDYSVGQTIEYYSNVDDLTNELGKSSTRVISDRYIQDGKWYYVVSDPNNPSRSSTVTLEGGSTDITTTPPDGLVGIGFYDKFVVSGDILDSDEGTWPSGQNNELYANYNDILQQARDYQSEGLLGTVSSDQAEYVAEDSSISAGVSLIDSGSIENRDSVMMDLVQALRDEGNYEAAAATAMDLKRTGSTSEIRTQSQSIYDDIKGVGVFDLADETKDGSTVYDMFAEVANPFAWVFWGKAVPKVGAWGLSKIPGGSALTTSTGRLLNVPNSLASRLPKGLQGATVVGGKFILEEVVAEELLPLAIGAVAEVVSPGSGMAARDTSSSVAMILTGGADGIDITQHRIQSSLENLEALRKSGDLDIDAMETHLTKLADAGGGKVYRSGDQIQYVTADGTDLVEFRVTDAGDISASHVLGDVVDTSDVRRSMQTKSQLEDGQSLMTTESQKEATTQAARTLSSKPEPVVVTLSNGNTMTVDPATYGQWLRMLARSDQLGAEITATMDLTVTGNRVTINEYVMPERSQVIHFSDSADASTLMMRSRTARDGLDSLQGYMDMVDLDASFGIKGKTWSQLTSSEQSEVLRQTLTRKEILSEGATVLNFGTDSVETSGQLVLKSGVYGDDAGNIREAMENVVAFSDQMDLIDIRRTSLSSGDGANLAELDPNERLAVTFDALNARAYVTADGVLSPRTDALANTPGAHTHPLAHSGKGFNTGSPELDTMLSNFQSQYPFSVKNWQNHPEILDAVKTKGKGMLEGSTVESYQYLQRYYSEGGVRALMEEVPDSDAFKGYSEAEAFKSYKGRVRQVLESEDDAAIEAMQTLLQAEGCTLPRFDSMTGESLEGSSRDQLWAFIREGHAENVPETSLIREGKLHQVIGEFVDQKSNFEKSTSLLKVLEQNPSDAELMFHALDRGVFQPSGAGADLTTMLRPGKAITLEDGTRVYMESINNRLGNTLVIVEEGSTEVQIINTVGDKVFTRTEQMSYWPGVEEQIGWPTGTDISPTPATAAVEIDILKEDLDSAITGVPTTPTSTEAWDMSSTVKEDTLLLREARRLSGKHSTEVNNLLEQLSKGNLNPGIGTRSIQGASGVSEARSRGGARVYFIADESGKSIQVVGYSTKANQQRVINKLTALYGN